MVERQLPKLNVVGSIPIARSNISMIQLSLDRETVRGSYKREPLVARPRSLGNRAKFSLIRLRLSMRLELARSEALDTRFLLRPHPGSARMAAPIQMISIIAGSAQRRCQRRSAAWPRQRELGWAMATDRAISNIRTATR